ncbi:hypothetical protein Airi01_032760 [Actinoallomurus iriomotensis]|uniref:Tyr recombinase domain-containing protein n=1 Tax=Actinoallomurus iriomotensis TaxID=478107 RepID=A0A9W6VPN2_9ACTN|nr:hypothetical protein Airi01_032760 [Actinoallomurus iriomotensis]
MAVRVRRRPAGGAGGDGPATSADLRSWGRIRKAARPRRRPLPRHPPHLRVPAARRAPPHIVRDIVGHSDIEVTMSIYAHAALDEKRKALKKLGDALG